MKKLTVITISALLLFQCMQCIAQAKEKILVIGVTSKEVSEIDGRLLREETMRCFHNSGFVIVPVMDLEREMRERSTIIQLVSDKDILALADSFNAQWAIKGNLYGGKDTRRFTLHIYNTVNGKKYSSDLEIPEGEFPEIIPELASRMFRKTRELIESVRSQKE
jgi:hypothetical protein